ncbi:hypothetical protein ScPMuIL_017075 [Solemya velum]
MALEVSVACVLLLTCVTLTFAVNLQTTIHCHVRRYSYHADKSIRNEDGSVLLPCWDNILVNSCWGRCDSSEIANYKMPYKISHHPVCTYGRYRRRTVQLTHCDPRHPDRSYTVIDAVSCNCKLCNPHNTSCESLSG